MVLISNKTNLYEVDYALWLETTLEQVKNRQLEELDWENLAQEIEGLGIALHHKIDGYLRQLLIHLLLYKYWLEEKERCGKGWKIEIRAFRDELASLLESKTLYNFFITRIDLIYSRARKAVIEKTDLSSKVFPEQCPFSVSELLDSNFYPES